MLCSQDTPAGLLAAEASGHLLACAHNKHCSHCCGPHLMRVPPRRRPLSSVRSARRTWGKRGLSFGRPTQHASDGVLGRMERPCPAYTCAWAHQLDACCLTCLQAHSSSRIGQQGRYLFTLQGALDRLPGRMECPGPACTCEWDPLCQRRAASGSAAHQVPAGTAALSRRLPCRAACPGSRGAASHASRRMPGTHAKTKP